MCAIKFNSCFLKSVKIPVAVFWFVVVFRGFVVFGQWVDLRTVFLCLILGSCGVSGFSLFSWSLFLVNLCTLCLFVRLCGVSSFVTNSAPVTRVRPIFVDGVCLFYVVSWFCCGLFVLPSSVSVRCLYVRCL